MMVLIEYGNDQGPAAGSAVPKLESCPRPLENRVGRRTRYSGHGDGQSQDRHRRPGLRDGAAADDCGEGFVHATDSSSRPGQLTILTEGPTTHRP